MWKIGTQTWIHTYLFFFDYFSRTLAHLISQCVWVYHLKYFRILIIKNSCKEEKKKKKKKTIIIASTKQTQMNQLKTMCTRIRLTTQHSWTAWYIFSLYVCVCGCKTRVVCFRRSCACWFSLNSAFELINQSAKYMQAADSDSMGWNQLLDLYWFLNAIHLCT